MLVVLSIFGFMLHFLVGLSDRLMAMYTDSCRPAGKSIQALAKQVQGDKLQARQIQHPGASTPALVFIRI